MSTFGANPTLVAKAERLPDHLDILTQYVIIARRLASDRLVYSWPKADPRIGRSRTRFIPLYSSSDKLSFSR